MRQSIFRAIIVAAVACKVLCAGWTQAEEMKKSLAAVGNGLPAKAIWIDAYANCQRLSNHENIESFMTRVKASGADTVVLSVKDVSGLVLYPSRIAPHMSLWSELARGTPQACNFPAGFDAVKDVLETGHRFGLKVYAGFPVFTEGTLRAGADYRIGPVFLHPDWETVIYRSGKMQKISSSYPFVFVNPVIKEVQDYELSLLREIVEKYAFDGLCLDYCRFADFNADFSQASRQAFEQYIGCRVAVWPDDVFGGGIWRTKWLKWRSQVIRDFVEKAKATATKARPKCAFSAYYGGWYRHHWGMGVNWASNEFKPTSSLASSDYHQTGMAEIYDCMMLGYYFGRITRKEANDNPNRPTVEGAIDMAYWVTQKKTPLIGGLYMLMYKNRPERLKQAIKLIRSKGQGVMLFDLYWIERYNYWDAIRDAWTDKVK